MTEGAGVPAGPSPEPRLPTLRREFLVVARFGVAASFPDIAVFLLGGARL